MDAKIHKLVSDFIDELYTFQPGTNVTKEAGQRTWFTLHKMADVYPCPPCKPLFQTAMSGIHDLFNIHLGKPVHDERRFKEFVGMVGEAKRVRHEVVVHR